MNCGCSSHAPLDGLPGDITPEVIKRIRNHYGLSQQAFARILGIGEASIARYENGAKPTKANANLIRAAAIPQFMADCLQRDGEALSAKQRENVERIVYAEVTFNDEGETMDVNTIYELTLQQEVLNEKAWGILAQLARARAEAKACNDEGLEMIYHDIELQIAKLVPLILSEESSSTEALCEIKGQLSGFEKLLETQLAKAA